jgi:hypothetical protein
MFLPDVFLPSITKSSPEGIQDIALHSDQLIKPNTECCSGDERAGCMDFERRHKSRNVQIDFCAKAVQIVSLVDTGNLKIGASIDIEPEIFTIPKRISVLPTHVELSPGKICRGVSSLKFNPQ